MNDIASPKQFAAAEATREFDVERIRADFPILSLAVGGKPLVYLDNAASSQMPQPVIDRLLHYRTREHANINRGVHHLSQTATTAYEDARGKVARFINAADEREVIFTSGTTDGINLVMHGWGRKFIDLTALVSAWVSGAQPNHGIVVQDPIATVGSSGTGSPGNVSVASSTPSTVVVRTCT